jgi:hypothetical protein
MKGTVNSTVHSQNNWFPFRLPELLLSRAWECSDSLRSVAVLILLLVLILRYFWQLYVRFCRLPSPVLFDVDDPQFPYVALLSCPSVLFGGLTKVSTLIIYLSASFFSDLQRLMSIFCTLHTPELKLHETWSTNNNSFVHTHTQY